MDYQLIAFRLFFAFFMVLFFFQFAGGKRQFSQMTTFDLISNFVLSAILSGYLFNPDADWQSFLYVLAIYFVLSYAINLLAQRTQWGRGIIIGTPTVIIEDGKINIKKLHHANMSMTDFMSLLRTKKVHSLTDVKLAQIEVGGDLTVVKKGEEYFAVILIENGDINEDNLKRIKKTKKWLDSQLKKHHIKNIKDVFYAQWLDDDFYVVKF